MRGNNLNDFKKAFAEVTAAYEAEIAENILWIDDVITLEDATMPKARTRLIRGRRSLRSDVICALRLLHCV